MLQRSAENKPIYIVRKDHDDIIVQVGPALRKSEQNGDPDHVTPGPPDDAATPPVRYVHLI